MTSLTTVTPALPETLYQSRLVLDPSAPLTIQAMQDCHVLHQLVQRGFPEAASGAYGREEAGVLFRVAARDEAVEAPGPVLTVQSHTPPDWSRLPSGIVLATHADSVSVAEYRARLAAGTQVRVLATINATRCTAPPLPPIRGVKVPRGKRVPITEPAEITDWFRRQGERHGYVVHDISLRDGARAVRGVRAGEGHASRLVLSFATIAGLIEVTSPEMFLHAVAAGIGRGKAYGAGLLQLTHGPGAREARPG